MRRRSVLALGALLGLSGLLAACNSPSPTTSPGATGEASTESPATSPAVTSEASGPVHESSPPTGSPVTPSPARPIRPDGLIAVEEYRPGDPTIFSSAVFSNALIGGVAPRINWKDLEPSAGQFHWQVIDQVFAQAAASDKFVVLILVPGFGTPAWALQGVATATFARQYGLGAGNAAALPLPWDQTYLSRWFTFLQAVADRYGTNPAFRMISAAGPTSVSVEMSLPNGPADVSRWVALGYTPARYETAWKAAFEAYERIFPAQFISLALYPGLAIGNTGRPDASQRTATPASIVAEGLRDKAVFALQTSGLTGARSGSEGYDQVSSSSALIVTGFQLSTSATKNPGQMGDAASPVHALTLTFARGVAAHVDFLEVYEADVLNPAMQGVLRATLAQLPH